MNWSSSVCCIMEITQLAYDCVLGRHLLLARDVPAATTVLRQQPYAAVLYDDQVSQHCDFCFAASDKLLKCSRSKFAHYCSVAHQRAAWKAYYRAECEVLVACAPHVPPAAVRLAARVLWRKASEQSKDDAARSVQQRLQQHEPSGGFYADIEQLESHWDKLDDPRKIMYAQMAVLTRQYMQGLTQHQLPGASIDDPSHVDTKHIAQLLARLACNNHTVCDEELRPIGVGIYPLGALINHSCRPSCVQSFEGPSIVFRSLSDLKVGDQATISYLELAATRQERRRQLLQQYFFDIDAAASAAAAAAGKTAAGTDLSQGAVEVPLPAPVCCAASRQDQLLEPQLQWRPTCSNQPSAAAEQVEHNSSSFRLLSHSNSSKPPWPEDRPDKQLCQMLLLPPTAPSQEATFSMNAINNSVAGNASLRQQHPSKMKLSGGMCLVRQYSTVGHNAVAGLFADLQGVTQGDQVEESSGDDGIEVGLQIAAGDSVSLVGGAQLGQQRQSQCSNQHELGQPQQMDVVQWGDWGPAAAAAGITHPSSDLVTNAAIRMLQIWSLQQQADHLTSKGGPAAAVRLYQEALAAADGADIKSSVASCNGYCRIALGPKHILRARLLAGLLKAAVDEGSMWELALTTAQQLTPIYELVYPKVWPNLGLHYALTAKLAMYLQQPAVAGRMAAAAGQILQTTHSSGSQVLREVTSVRYEAQQEMEAYCRMHSTD